MKAGNCVWIRRKLVADWSYQCFKRIEKTHFFLWSIHVKYYSRVICSAPWVKCLINTSTDDIRTCAEGRCCTWMLFICRATARPVQLFAVSCFQLLAALSRRPGLPHELKIAFHSQPPRHLRGSGRYSRERRCAEAIDRPLVSAGRESCQRWVIHLKLHKNDVFFPSSLEAPRGWKGSWKFISNK